MGLGSAKPSELVGSQHVGGRKNANGARVKEDVIQAVVVIVSDNGHMLPKVFAVLVFGASAYVALDKSK
jgi:hypothetical protein